MFSSDIMDKLLGEADPTIQYDFTGVEGWCDRVPGGIGCLDEIFIPVNPDGNHLELHPCNYSKEADRAVGFARPAGKQFKVPRGDGEICQRPPYQGDVDWQDSCRPQPTFGLEKHR